MDRNKALKLIDEVKVTLYNLNTEVHTGNAYKASRSVMHVVRLVDELSDVVLNLEKEEVNE